LVAPVLSLRNLCALCASAVLLVLQCNFNAEAQSTQRLRPREELRVRLDTKLADTYTPSLARCHAGRAIWFLSAVLEILMPNHKSSEKRVRQSEKRRAINRGHRTKVRTYIKKVREALDSGKSDEIKSILPEAISVIDKSVQKGVMHKNAAARYKSRLTVQANQAGK
jgi:small subunit ribosomal protein S20